MGQDVIPENSEQVQKALDAAFNLRVRGTPLGEYNVTNWDGSKLHYIVGNQDSELLEAADLIVGLVARIAGREAVERYAEDMRRLAS